MTNNHRRSYFQIEDPETHPADNLDNHPEITAVPLVYREQCVRQGLYRGAPAHALYDVAVVTRWELASRLRSGDGRWQSYLTCQIKMFLGILMLKSALSYVYHFLRMFVLSSCCLHLVALLFRPKYL